MTLGKTIITRFMKKSSDLNFPVSEKTRETVDRIGQIIKDGYAVGPVDAAKWYYERLQDRGYDLLPVENEEYSELVAAIVVFLIQKENDYALDKNKQKLVQYSVISELSGIHKNHIIL